MDTTAILITLIGYPVALCVFALLLFVVVRAALRSALREHREALAAAAAPAHLAETEPATVAAPRPDVIPPTDAALPQSAEVPLRAGDPGPTAAAA